VFRCVCPGKVNPARDFFKPEDKCREGGKSGKQSGRNTTYRYLTDLPAFPAH